MTAIDPAWQAFDPPPPLPDHVYVKLKAGGHDAIKALCLPPRLSRPLTLAADRVCCAGDWPAIGQALHEVGALVAHERAAGAMTRAEGDALLRIFEGLTERRNAPPAWLIAGGAQ